MTTQIHEQYLKRVAAALKATGHPRREDVLEDLREHLNAIVEESGGPVTLDELADRLGSPEEYAESLAPAEGARKKPWFRQRRGRMAVASSGILLFFFVVGTFTFFPDRYAVKAHVREWTGSNFTAPSPFFNLETAQNLGRGLDGKGIRDAIGYPFKRYYGWSEEMRHRTPPAATRYADRATDREIIWEYTGSVEKEAPFYTVCLVITDMDEQLLRVETFRDTVAHNERSDVYRHQPYLKNQVASFQRPEDTRLVLRPENENLYVIASLIVEDVTSIEESQAHRREEIVSAWDDVPLDELRFIFEAGTGKSPLVEIGGPFTQEYEAFRTALAALPEDVPVYNTYAHATVSMAAQDALTLYHQGAMYAFPPIVWGSGQHEDATRRDQIWLLRKLLATESP